VRRINSILKQGEDEVYFYNHFFMVIFFIYAHLHINIIIIKTLLGRRKA